MSRTRNISSTAYGLARIVGPLLLVFIALTACGGTKVTPPKGDGPREASGKVALPAGAGVSLASLKVVTSLGSYPVSVDGSFKAQVYGDDPVEIAVQDGAGALVLSAVSTSEPAGAALQVDGRSSAAVLLYYALGGFTLPADAQGKLWDLIRSDAAVADIEAALLAAFAAGGLPMAEHDETVDDALEQAWRTVMGVHEMALGQNGAATGAGVTVEPFRTRVTVEPSGVLAAQGAGADNIVIEPDAGTVQSGVSVIHNPVGSGVAAQNTFRRPAALLAYQVGYQDEGGSDQTLTPPVLAGTVDVPSTQALGVFQALTDVVMGESPWSPVVSDGLPLPLHESRRTYYELVLLGPSLDVVTPPPLYSDARFSGQRSHWNDVIGGKALELFMNDIALPVLESFAFGSVGHFEAGKLAKLREDFKVVNDKHLANLGIFLKEGGGYAEGVKFILDELVTNERYRLDFFEVMVEAMPESERNKVSFEAVEARLKTKAAAAAVAAGVQIALSAGDIGAILKDLNDALPAHGWTATATPTLFVMSPEFAYFTKSEPQVEFQVSTRGPVSGTFLYRWSTTGRYGDLTDGPKKGTTIDTTYSSVWYTHRTPLNISDDQTDGVWVEVYEVEPGATTIPAGQAPTARMAAELKGFNREIDSRIEVQYGFTPPGYYKDGKSVECATMYVRIPKQAGVTKYALHFEGWGGRNHPNNYNVYLRANYSYNWYIDPSNADGWTWPFTAVCNWFRPSDGQPFGPPVSFQNYDDGNDYLVAVYTFVGFVEGAPEGALTQADHVRLWYDWASQGTLTATVTR